MIIKNHQRLFSVKDYLEFFLKEKRLLLPNLSDYRLLKVSHQQVREKRNKKKLETYTDSLIRF